MKSTSIVILSVLSVGSAAFAQDGSGSTNAQPIGFVQQVGSPGNGSWALTEAGSDHRIWAKTIQVPAGDGSWLSVTNSYTEIGTGLNVWSQGANSWVPASDEIEILEDGAIARKSQHTVSFNGDLTDQTGTITLVTPEGQRMRSQVFGLVYTELDTGKTALLSGVKASQGAVLDSNKVLYTNAFDSVNADILYTTTIGSFDQDVVFRDNHLPDPASLGLNPAKTLLQVWTEFFEAPQPNVQVQALARPNAMNESNQRLGFGRMQINGGGAFLSSVDDGPAVRTGVKSIPVARAWETVEGRTFLVESAPYAELQAKLNELPVQGVAIPRKDGNSRAFAATKITSGSRRDVAKMPRQPGPRLKMLASTAHDPRRGLVMDYSLAGTTTDFTFKANNTYYLTYNISLSGNTVIEGGAIVKAANTNWTSISVYGPLSCLTAPYRPAVFTSMHDDTVGETIAGSSGTPASGGIALSIDNGQSTSLQNLRVLNYNYGIEFLVDGELKHSQILNTIFGVNYSHYGGTGLRCQNDLISVVSSNALQATYANITGENITFAGVHALVSTISGGSVILTNCLLVKVTDQTGYTGDYNQSFGSISAFSSVGAADYYLASGSPYRNAGTTHIDTQLLSDLAQRTTYPPIILTSSFAVDTVLAPQAQRDTDTPDLGYHYDPLDFCLSNLSLSATLTLTNGCVLGIYGTNGLALQSGSALISEGTPQHLNRIAYAQGVQENTSVWPFINAPVYSLLTLPSSASTLPDIQLRFTRVDWPALDLVSDPSSLGCTWTMADCQLTLCRLQLAPVGDARTRSLTMRNNLLEGNSYSFAQGLSLTQGASSSSTPFAVSLWNNLFSGASVTLKSITNTAAWTVDDNLLASGTSNYGTNHFGNGSNAYYSMTQIPGSSGGDITLTNLDFQVGALGSYYYPPAGGYLSSLVDAGSRTAAAAGLYQYTTSLDQNKEGGSTVDIGFHYVSLDAASGLVGFWKMNDGSGTTATDSSVNANNGTLINGPTWTTGPDGHDGTIQFDGVNDYINIGDPANGSLDFGTNSFSYGMWLYVYNNVDPYDFAWYKGGSFSGDPGYDIELGSGSWDADVADNSSVYTVSLSSGIYNQWVNFFVVVDRTAKVLQLYINGTLQASTDITGLTGSVSNAKSASIGKASDPLHARIDEVRVYNRALSAAEVVSFTAGTPRDSDSDGVPDYLEDRNGNGTVDSGETDWQNASDSGLHVLITEPKANSNIP